MQTLSRAPQPVPVSPAAAPPTAVAGRIATHVLQSAGSYGRRAGATMFLWLLATRDTPPQSDW
ncbi:hypothetical protein LX16_2779 [Stackebrandtia albiflava]|uniref:Uncharacterized protein n=1 Tax=Stackebrandtia albiflava TaxID=406432 RepID=A0A562V2H1_9ACTN|nr:hypothetical protein [Stackebrandtia albiflava]TWJ12033.1 hypothetical protein LX16_2779 [Stackebrandtia albiflava]